MGEYKGFAYGVLVAFVILMIVVVVYESGYFWLGLILSLGTAVAVALLVKQWEYAVYAGAAVGGVIWAVGLSG